MVVKERQKPVILKRAEEQAERFGNKAFILNAMLLCATILTEENHVSQLAIIEEKFSSHTWILQPQIAIQFEPYVVEAASRKFAGDYNSGATEAWQDNARVIARRYKGDVRNIFVENEFDDKKIADVLTSQDGPFRNISQFSAQVFLDWVKKYNLLR